MKGKLFATQALSQTQKNVSGLNILVQFQLSNRLNVTLSRLLSLLFKVKISDLFLGL